MAVSAAAAVVVVVLVPAVMVFLAMLSRKVLTFGKSISLAIGNNVDYKAPAAFFFGSCRDIGGCEAVTFSFSRLPLCFVIYTGSVELTMLIFSSSYNICYLSIIQLT